MDAIILDNVSKHFRKGAIRREYSTFKTELLRLFKRSKPSVQVDRPLVTQALTNLSLRIPKGKTFGLLGRNGSGKSTLLKLITGIYAPSSGQLQVNGRISALLDLGAGFHPDFSGRENIHINGIILGLTRAEIRERMDEIIAFSELGDFIDEPVRTYSSGMYMRLAFSVATHVDPEILIIDEILAVGDAQFARKSRAKMEDFKKRGKTILLVTHDLGTVEDWCDGAAWLDRGVLRAVGAARDIVGQYMQEVNAAAGKDTAAASEVTSLPARLVGAGADITEARWLDANGRARSELSATERATFECVLAGFSRGLPLRLKVTLRRDIGTPLWEGAMDVPEGATTVRLEFPRLPFVDGAYSVDASLLTPEGDTVRSVEALCQLHLKTGTVTGGMVLLDCDWKFDVTSTRPLHVVREG